MDDLPDSTSLMCVCKHWLLAFYTPFDGGVYGTEAEAVDGIPGRQDDAAR